MQSKRYFWWFVLIHCVLWTILPAVMRYALPHDTIEGVMWGQHLEWGYDKNPWMHAWLTRLGWEIGGTSGIGIYAVSSFFVGLSFWSVWKLAEKILSPLSALIAVFLLEGCVNYTLVPQGFNDNIIQLGLWPLMLLCFYNAMESQKIRDWSLTGIFAGLAMMAKYFTAVPLCVMGLFLLTHKETRVSFRHIGLYIGLVFFTLIILPHLIWLFQHDFLPLRYAFGRADAVHESFWKLHLYYPFDFAYTQILDFLLPVVMVLVLKVIMASSVIPAMDGRYPEPGKLHIYRLRNYLFWMSLGPFLLTFLLSVIFGWRLYSEWGVPIVSLWGLLLVMISKLEVNDKIFKKFMVFIYILMFLWAIGYVVGLYIPSKNKHSDNYPAQEIANYVQTQWWNTYHKPLKYVAGSRYIGGYLAFYGKDHPSVFVDWNEAFSPWINLEEMKKYGVAFVQDDYYGTTVFGKHPYTNQGRQFPQEISKEYPTLIILPVKYFSWKRGNKNDESVPVLIGFLPLAN